MDDSARTRVHNNLTATTRQQARLLHDRNYSRLLGPLVNQELSAAALARLTGVDLKAVHHRLTRLLEAGLIVVCAEQTRSGRPVKIYRAVAQEFQVPFHLTSVDTFADLIAALQRPHLQQHYAVVGELLMRLSRGTFTYLSTVDGSLRGTVQDQVPTEQDGEFVAHSTYYRYRLTREQASEAAQRLTELTEWLEEKSMENGQDGLPYTLGLLLSPEKLE